MTKQKEKEKTEKPEKSLFTIINLANSIEQQKRIARFAAQMAKALDMDVVLYPQIDEIQISFEEGGRRLALIAAKIKAVHDIRICKEPITMFPLSKSLHTFATMFRFSKSLNTIAEKEHAEFIIMGRKKDIGITLKANNHFGKTMWYIAENSNFPIIALGLKAEFNPFKKITIAMDKERKFQKMTVVRTFAKTFGSFINIFLESVSDASMEATNEIMLGHMKKNLNELAIPYKVTKARNREDFVEHLCNIAEKRSDLLLVEVEPGKINTVIKKNIEKLLNINQNFPVLFVKTQSSGNNG